MTRKDPRIAERSAEADRMIARHDSKKASGRLITAADALVELMLRRKSPKKKSRRRKRETRLTTAKRAIMSTHIGAHAARLMRKKT